MRSFWNRLTVLLAVYLGVPGLPYGQEIQTMTLEDAVAYALESNRELGAVRHELEAASFGTWEAKSAYLPQVFFQSQFSSSESDLFDVDPPDLPPPFDELFAFGDVGGFTGDIYTNQFRFTQIIYDRTILGDIAIAKLRNEAARWQEKGQRQQVVLDAVTAYLDVLRAHELLAVQEQRLRLAEKQLESATAGFQAGVRIQTDVSRAELTRFSAESDLVAAEITRDQALVLLNEIIGISVSTRYALQGQDLSIYNPPKDGVNSLRQYPRFVAQSETHNPAILVADILLQQQEESWASAKGEFYPRLSVGGNWGFRENQLNFEEQEWMFFATVDLPLFEGGRKWAKIRRTDEERKAQAKRYEDITRKVHRSVEQSALALQQELRNLQIAVQSEQVAQENHQRFLNLYQEGLADTLDVTQSITEWVEAQTQVVTTRYGYMRVMAQLLFSMGMIPTESEAYASTGWLSLSAFLPDNASP